MKLLTKLDTLSNVLYQHAGAIDSEKMARELIKTLNDNLKNAYDFINKLDDSGLLDQDNHNLFELLDARDAFDVYQVGDVINLLDGLKIEVIDADKVDI